MWNGRDWRWRDGGEGMRKGEEGMGEWRGREVKGEKWNGKEVSRREVK